MTAYEHDIPASTHESRPALKSSLRPVLMGVMTGIVLGFCYSVATRSATADPFVEGRVTPDAGPISIADAKSGMTTLHDTDMRPIETPRAPMAFQSLATLSAPGARREADIRRSKAVATGASFEPQGPDTARPGDKTDAVAAVWGFLAVGLGGSTANAGVPKTNIRRSR